MLTIYQVYGRRQETFKIMAAAITRNNFSSVDNLQLTDTLGLQFSGRTSDPSDADLAAGRLYYNSDTGALKVYTGAAWTTLGSGGGGGGGSLNEAYENGRTITVDTGAVTLTDASTGALNTLQLNKTGAGTGNVLGLDMDAGIAAVGIYIDAGAGARTGSDIQVKDDSTGAHSVIDIDSSGSGASVGFDFTGSYNGSPAGQALKITLDANDNLDTEIMEVTTGAGARAIMFDLNFGHTDSGTTSHIFDIDVTAVLDSNIWDFATSAACTGNVFFVNLDSGVAMTALHVEGSGVRTQPMIEVATDATGSANLVTFVVTGAISGNVLDFQMDTTSTGNAIDIDMNASVGGKAIYLDSGAATRTAVLVDVLADGDGDADVFNIDRSNTGAAIVFDINVSGIGTGNVVDITYSAADTGNALNVVMADNVAGAALNITGAGTRTDSIIEVVSAEDGSVDGMVLLQTTGVFTGSMLTIHSDAAATTGSLLHLDLDAGVAYKAITFDLAGARTVPVMLATFDGTFGSAGGGTFLDANITMTGAGASPFVDVDITDAYTGNVLDVLIGAVLATGDVIKVDLGATATGSQALVIASGAMARTTALISVTDAGTNSGGILFDINSTGARAAVVFDIDDTGITTGNVFDYATNSASTGTIFEINLTNAVAAKLNNYTLAGTRTANATTITSTAAGAVDLFQIDDSGTSSGHVFDINISGNSTGNVLDIVYSSSAVQGDAIHVDMATNLAGNALQIDAAGTRTAPLINIVNTGADGGTDDHIILISQTGVLDSNIIDIEYSSGASTGNALDIAMGTNVDGMAITVSSAGTGVSNEGSALNVAHTGALVSGADVVRISATGSISATSNLLSLEQNTGAGTAGANALHINATGTNVEAIEIEAGLFFMATSTANGAGNGETIVTTANIAFYDPAGASRTGVILASGLRDGQQVTVVNFADAAEDITFAASGTSNVAGGASVVISQFESCTFTWNATRSLWYAEKLT